MNALNKYSKSILKIFATLVIIFIAFNNIYIKEEAPTMLDFHQISDETYMAEHTLRPGYRFYRGREPMRNIEKIIFTSEKPVDYDEFWSANEAGTFDIIGYRSGTCIYIVSDEIYTNPYSGYLLAATRDDDSPLWSSLKEIVGLKHLNTQYTEDFTACFYNQNNFNTFDIALWDMSSAKDISFMFAGCTSLTSLDVSLWNVSSVENFKGFLSGNNHIGDMAIKYVPVSEWDMSSAKDISYMFYGCAQMEYIDISNWDVSRVEDFSHMFADCFSLKELNFSSWKTCSAKSFDAFLNDCRSLKIIDVSSFETENCSVFSQMFESCVSLEGIIGLENFIINPELDIFFMEMFQNCPLLKDINLSNFTMHRAKKAYKMFAGCSSLAHIDAPISLLPDSVITSDIFAGCDKLAETERTKIINLQNN